MTIKSPYRLYPQQKAYIKKGIEWYNDDSKKYLLMQAPTGLGKTLTNLFIAMAAIKKRHRVIYFSREHAQIDQCTYELTNIYKINPGLDIRAVHIAGKSVSCIRPEVKNMRDTDEQQQECTRYDGAICNYHSKLNRRYKAGASGVQLLVLQEKYHNVYANFDINDGNTMISLFEEHMLEIIDQEELIAELFEPGIVTNQHVISIAKKYTICPRRIEKLAIDHANIIFCPYNYMVLPRISFASNDFYIIDEAHNLDGHLTDMLSNNITSKTLQNFRRNMGPQLNHVDVASKVVLQPIIDLKRNDNTVLIGRDLIKFFENKIPRDSMEILSEELNKFIERRVGMASGIDDGEVDVERIPRSFLSVRRFLGALIRLYDEPSSGIIYIDGNYIKIKFVNSDVIFSEVVSVAHKVMITSGSLYPSYMVQYLGIHKDKYLAYEFDTPNIYTTNTGNIFSKYMNKTLSTKWDNRDEFLYRAYADIVRDIYNSNSEGTLAFFPSYAFLGQVGNILKDMNIKYYTPEMVDDYRARIKTGKRALFMSAFRGKGSEGWNFPDDQSRAVLLCGIPYLTVNDPVVSAQRTYYMRKGKSLGEKWYNQKAALWIMQAFGRGMRHKDDYTQVYFLDSRIMRLRMYFVEWVRNATNWTPKEWIAGDTKHKMRNVKVRQMLEAKQQ